MLDAAGGEIKARQTRVGGYRLELLDGFAIHEIHLPYAPRRIRRVRVSDPEPRRLRVGKEVEIDARAGAVGEHEGLQLTLRRQSPVGGTAHPCAGVHRGNIGLRVAARGRAVARRRVARGSLEAAVDDLVGAVPRVSRRHVAQAAHGLHFPGQCGDIVTRAGPIAGVAAQSGARANLGQGADRLRRVPTISAVLARMTAGVSSEAVGTRLGLVEKNDESDETLTSPGRSPRAGRDAVMQRQWVQPCISTTLPAGARDSRTRSPRSLTKKSV